MSNCRPLPESVPEHIQKFGCDFGLVEMYIFTILFISHKKTGLETNKLGTQLKDKKRQAGQKTYSVTCLFLLRIEFEYILLRLRKN
jgi:hypothetical protein